MNECLVTKLKSSINDETLKILGGFNASVYTNPNNGYVVLQGLAESPVIVHSKSVKIRPSSGQDISIDDYTIKCVNGFFADEAKGTTFDILVKNKYSLRAVSLGSGGFIGIDSSELNYCKNIESFIVNNVMGGIEKPAVFNINDIVPNKLKKIDIGLYEGAVGQTVLTGSLVELIRDCSVELLTFVVVKNNGLILPSTKLEDLVGRFTSITRLSFENCSNVIGSVELFVSSQRSAGRKTCDGITIPSMANLGNATFNGEIIARTSGDKTLSWTETSITLGGVTITA